MFCHLSSENETREWHFTLLCKHLVCMYLPEIRVSATSCIFRWSSFSSFMHMALKQVEVSYASWGPLPPCHSLGVGRRQKAPVRQQCQEMGIVMYRWNRIPPVIFFFYFLIMAYFNYSLRQKKKKLCPIWLTNIIF